MSLTLVKDPAVDTLPKLNIGCGMNPEEGFINLDIVQTPGVDVVHDLTVAPWPFPDNHFGAIKASHALEHIPMDFVQYGDRKIDALVAVMNECWRTLAPGGRMLIDIPTVHGPGAFQDPTHRRFLVENSIYYFARKADFVPGTTQYKELVFKRYLAAKEMSFSMYAKLPLADKNAIREESVEWGKSKDGNDERMNWDWKWYGSDIGCIARFDCLRAELEGSTAFMSIWLEKPRE